ncbi:MAG: HAD family hydrolase [Myxococcota bacterium]
MDRKLLILDLDETLIFAQETEHSTHSDFQCGHYHVQKRPHLDSFLTFCRKHFEVAVWTSSNASYATCIVQNIFPEGYPLSFVWSRSKCTTKFDEETWKTAYIKDLKKVKRLGYLLEQILIIDDSPKKLQRNYGNLIRIKPFEGDSRDDQLFALIGYLQQLRSVENVREIEKRGWYRHIERKS